MPGRIATQWILLVLVGAVSLWAQGTSVTRGYRIGAKDLLDIRVFEEPDLNVERRVSADGSVTLPLLGEVSVEGYTEEELSQRLEAALEQDYLQRATVTVQVIEYRSRPITAIGAVRTPGILELSGRWTLLETLTEAGGLADNHGKSVFVLRRAENGLSDQIEIDLDDLLVRADPSVNIPIFPADVINVPTSVSVTVYCLGEIQQPGAVTFQAEGQATLLGAIAQAGGLTDRAADKIRIKRRSLDGQATELVVSYKKLLSGKEPNLDLMPGDLIVVKESFF